QPNPLKSLMFAPPISLCPLKFARVLFKPQLKKIRLGRATSCESGRVGVEAFTNRRRFAQPFVTTGCGYWPTGYLPTGYLRTGYLPMGAAATGGGSLRGKSAAAATLSMATSPAVTIMIVFMMLIPLCWHPARADRVTPHSALSLQDARFTIPRSGSIARRNGSRLFVALIGRKVQMHRGIRTLVFGSGRVRTRAVCIRTAVCSKGR